MNLIQTLEQEEIARLGKTIPDFAPGDTVIVSVNVVEGTRKRVQAYEGVVIAKRNRGLNSGFIVRKISSGEGVERTFQIYSPLIAGIEVKRRGDVRRAKLYYLRERSGKSARIKEKLAYSNKAAAAASKPVAPPRESRRRPCRAAAVFRSSTTMPIDPIPPLPADLPPLSKIPDFDPRAVPVVGIDAHLPAVARRAAGARRLRERFRAAPAWEPEICGRAPLHRPRSRRWPRCWCRSCMRDEPTVLLTERTTHLNDAFRAGGFPGGKRDDTDADAVAHGAARGRGGDRPGRRPGRGARAACRPTPPAPRFIVTPVVALVRPPCVAAAEPARGGRRLRGAAALPDGPGPPPAPRLRVRRACSASGSPCRTRTARDERFIWGATAAMLRNFYRFLRGALTCAGRAAPARRRRRARAAIIARA